MGQRFASIASTLDEEAQNRTALFDLANLYHANEYDDRAQFLYNWLIESESDPETLARLNYLAAQLVKERGYSEEALAYLEASVAAFDGYGQAIVQLGEARLKTGDLEAAETLFRKGMANDSQLVSAYLGLARVHEQRGQLDLAIEALEKVLTFDAENTPAKALLSQLYARSGDKRQAYLISESIAYSTSPPESDPWLQEVKELILDTQRLDFLFLDYFMVGLYEEAEPYLQRMEEIEPENPRWSRYRAIMYMSSGYFEKAESEIREGLENGGEVDVFYPLLVKSLSLRGQSSEAETVAREAIERFGPSGELNLEWARLLMEKQSYEEAMTALNQGLEAKPYDLELHFTRARLGLKLGKTEEASESLKMVRQLAPMDSEAQVRAALVLMEAGRFDEALPFLNQARNASPYYADAIELLADAYFEIGRVAQSKGRIDQALESYNRSLEFAPRRLDVLGARAQLAIESGRLEVAEVALRELLSVTGEKPGMLLIYGDILFRSGKVAEARTHWRIALGRLGESEQESQLQRKLDVRLQQSSAFIRGGK
ncbi:tetratricopeptide repeat protein [Pelagicoccus sp. SDUM812003]|uniref:tetratricopeptide repeat protein n=1 Tax=Pelagicoccus sp. SDUM812003 TaxID=3041267 RepID=UPI00280E1782|nr:tetratricopeptide repeat protein [Pelagicoccus sp. SDUM812003]MDQ8203513.1 tetratricopeptide repeat protein [Pelagicoccus sp. SDUM812003]